MGWEVNPGPVQGMAQGLEGGFQQSAALICTPNSRALITRTPQEAKIRNPVEEPHNKDQSILGSFLGPPILQDSQKVRDGPIWSGMVPYGQGRPKGQGWFQKVRDGLVWSGMVPYRGMVRDGPIWSGTSQKVRDGPIWSGMVPWSGMAPYGQGWSHTSTMTSWRLRATRALAAAASRRFPRPSACRDTWRKEA